MIDRTLRQFDGDWEPVSVPNNVQIDESAYVYSAAAFELCRSDAPVAVRLGRGSQVNDGTLFDVGPLGHVEVGEGGMLNAVCILCDAGISIGDYTMISWSVVLMDTYRFSLNVDHRRDELRALPFRDPRRSLGRAPARPITIGGNVWIGFDAIVLPGVTIGEGSIVGARSVVAEDVPPYTIVAGNPARPVRRFTHQEVQP